MTKKITIVFDRKTIPVRNYYFPESGFLSWGAKQGATFFFIRMLALG